MSLDPTFIAIRERDDARKKLRALVKASNEISDLIECSQVGQARCRPAVLAGARKTAASVLSVDFFLL